MQFKAMKSKKVFTVAGALVLTGATAVAAMAVNMGVLGSAGAAKAGNFAPTTQLVVTSQPETTRPTTTKKVPSAAPRTSLLPPITVVVTEPVDAAPASAPVAAQPQVVQVAQTPASNQAAPVAAATASGAQAIPAAAGVTPVLQTPVAPTTLLAGTVTTATPIGSYESEDSEDDGLTEAEKQAAEALKEAEKNEKEAGSENEIETEDDD